MNSRWDEAPDCDGGEVFSLASLFSHTRVPPIRIFFSGWSVFRCEP